MNPGLSPKISQHFQMGDKGEGDVWEGDLKDLFRIHHTDEVMS